RINVNPFGAAGGIVIVRQSGIHVLNEVVPHMPLPDDPCAVWPLGFELDQHIGPYPVWGYELRPAADPPRLLRGPGFPGDRQHIAVGKNRHIVVREASRVVVREVPDEISVEVELLKSASLPAAAEYGSTRVAAAAKEMAILQQIHPRARQIVAIPGPNDFAVEVDEIRGIGA